MVALLMVFPLTAFAVNLGFNLNLSFGKGSAGSGWNVGSLSSTGLPSGSIMGIIINIAYWLLGILGIVGVIGFAISGILYLLSAGDETMTERAKSAMKYSILGVIVGLSGVVFIQAVNLMLKAISGF